ncbi:tyrosine-type recombinase/integrase [Aliiroseovarius sp. KMU-71]|uniref:tyrosine-type recombinase/integrase n=1 Tax=Aliiroseovarius sp. KMU-71 TaxID=3453123 RepID=UPI003F44C839
MPKIAKEMSPLEVKRLAHSGAKGKELYAVGGVSGLNLQIMPSGARSWLLRVRIAHKRREIGLGGYPTVTLAQARERARDYCNTISEGRDPLAEKRAARAALIATQRRELIFSEAMERYFEAKLDAFKNEKHRKQWQSTLRTYAEPEIGAMDVDTITTQDVLRVLQPIWWTKTETATRLRGRIEAVLSWATVSGHRTGENPAAWRGNLKELLPAPSQIKTEINQPAVNLTDLPRFYAALKNASGISARALEFALLTAARSGEVRGASWDEIDLEKKLWVIPAQRMKAGREHRVPLSVAALGVISDLPRIKGSKLLFTAPRGGELSDMALSQTMRRLHRADSKGGFFDTQSKRLAVPHGLRSTFRDWVAEETDFAGDMAEVALAHKVSNAVEAAYRRGAMVEKRRKMMDAWAERIQENIGGA